ncbi:MAG: hypothetical protein WCV84_04255 [Patescibacteria group bacterium]
MSKRRTIPARLHGQNVRVFSSPEVPNLLDLLLEYQRLYPEMEACVIMRGQRPRKVPIGQLDFELSSLTRSLTMAA